MNLSYLNDQALLCEVKHLSQKEKQVTTKLLWHLKEVESRRLFSDLGYPSMFRYVAEELNYSESSALRRIQASRMLFETPEIAKKIEDGALTLGNLAQASRFFNENNIRGKEKKC